MFACKLEHACLTQLHGCAYAFPICTSRLIDMCRSIDINLHYVSSSDTGRPSEASLMCSLSKRHEEEWAGPASWTKPQVKATWVKGLVKALTILEVALVSMCAYYAFEA